MQIESSIYKKFHKYINILYNNAIYSYNENLDNENSIHLYNMYLNDVLNNKYLYCIDVPYIDIHDYIDKIIDFIQSENVNIDGFIINAICLLNRILTKIIINNYNIHRIIAGIMMLSDKIYNDIYYSNCSWAYVCGITVKDINNIELHLLQLLNYNTFIRYEEMVSIAKSIQFL